MTTSLYLDYPGVMKQLRQQLVALTKGSSRLPGKKKRKFFTREGILNN
jgi:hypothetical protein